MTKTKLYRVGFRYTDGALGSERIGLPMSKIDAELAASRANRTLVSSADGKYEVIGSDE